MENKKYYYIEKKTLAISLNFLGFRYEKFNGDKGLIYKFKDTEKFRQAMNGLFNFRKSLNIKY